MVIGGWTDPQGTRSGLGALLLGYYADGNLIYAGKAGTGFDTKTLETLARELRGLYSPTSPFADITSHPGPETHWALRSAMLRG